MRRVINSLCHRHYFILKELPCLIYNGALSAFKLSIINKTSSIFRGPNNSQNSWFSRSQNYFFAHNYKKMHPTLKKNSQYNFFNRHSVMPPIKTHFQIPPTHLPPIAPKIFRLAPNFTLIAPNIYKIAPRKYKGAPIN